MVFFPLQLPKHSKKKTEQSPAGPECPCQGGSRLCSTAAGSSWDAPGQSGPQSHCSQQRLWGRAVQELRFGHHKMSPHIAKLICTEVYLRAPFPFLCKENTVQPRQLSWLQRGVHSIPGDPAESLGTPAALPQPSRLLSISPSRSQAAPSAQHHIPLKAPGLPLSSPSPYSTAEQGGGRAAFCPKHPTPSQHHNPTAQTWNRHNTPRGGDLRGGQGENGVVFLSCFLRDRHLSADSPAELGVQAAAMVLC